MPLMPYVGKIDVEDVELCDEPSASIDTHMDDADKLLRAFEAVVTKHEPLVAKAVVKVEERCAAQRKMEKREAVEAATMAAIQTTELRMGVELRNAVADAMAEARAAAKVAQDKAVAEAVRLTEERCKEQQRLAVGSVEAVMKRQIGRPEEEIAASSARFNFQEASSAAAAAMEAAVSLLDRSAEEEEAKQDAATPAQVVDVSEDANVEVGAEAETEDAEKAAVESTAKEPPLQFF